MTREEFKKLERSTRASNKATSKERVGIAHNLRLGMTVYIYRGGKNLNALTNIPRYSKIRFILKPIQK